MNVTSRLVLSVACSIALACSGKEQPPSTVGPTPGQGQGGANASAGTGSANPTGPGSTAGGISLNIDAGAIDPETGGSGDGLQITTSLPPGFQQTEMGGFQLGASLAAGGTGGESSAVGGASSGGASGSANGNCGNVLKGVARDFKNLGDAGANPDFESPSFWGEEVTLNLVAGGLGTDKKPSYASKCELGTAYQSTACPYGAETTGQANFDQWYRDTPEANEPFVVSLYLAPQPGGLFTFQSLFYFPLDNVGFGNKGRANDNMMHNFGFTTEIHTQFSYSGGETFQFQGDDDVWVFINGKLAVDLGGLHPAKLGRVTLDDSAAVLGLQKGQVYPLDLFHAERHTDKSTFRIDTNLSFVNCGTVEESGPK